MSEEIILPNGYKQISYIQFNGNEYFNTDYIPTNNTGFKAEFSPTPHIYDRIGFLLGSNNGSSWGAASGIYFSGHYFPFYGWGGSVQVQNTNINGYTKIIAQLNYLNDRACIYNLGVTSYSKTGLADLKFTPEYPIYVGTINLKNSSVTYSFYGRINRVTITENDEIVRDYIPCLDGDGVPCFYDIKEGGTYYNMTEGEFMAPIAYYDNYDYVLPEGYKKCVYLQSDGTQFINTSIYKDINGETQSSSFISGIMPNNETGLYLKAQMFGYEDALPFGVSSFGNIICVPKITTSTKKGEYYWDSAVTFLSAYDKGDDLIYTSSINLYNDRTVHFNSEDTDWDGYLTTSISSYMYPLYLFGFNAAGSLSETNTYHGRIYRAKITQGIELIRDFVPCLDADGVPCMYDLIQGGTYYNNGEGEDFEYCLEHKLPSDFAKLKYLEATGTQYINTNYIPTNNTGLYIETCNITNSDAIPMGCRTSSNTNSRFFAHRLRTTSRDVGFGWSTWNQVTNAYGRIIYRSKLNFLNNRIAEIEAPLFSPIITNLSDLSFTPTLPIYMFGINQANALSYNWMGRIYRTKISEGDEIVRDYVPAYDSRLARPCMYDIVNNVVYYNNGTDEFLYNKDFEGDYIGFTQMGGIGNRVGGHYDELPLGYVRAYFLESTGTQYISTSLSVKNLSSKVVMRCYNTENGDGKTIIGSHYGANRYKVNANTSQSVGWILETPTSGTTWRMLNIGGFDVLCSCEINMNTLTATLKGVGKENQETFSEDYRNIDGYLALWANGGNEPNIASPTGTIAKIYSLECNYGSTPAARLIPCIDDEGRPSMYDAITKMPFNNSNTTGSDFIVGLTESQARDLYKLPPTTSGTLTISLPASIVDTDGITITDARVKSAKEKAEENGWTFTIHTYTE